MGCCESACTASAAHEDPLLRCEGPCQRTVDCNTETNVELVAGKPAEFGSTDSPEILEEELKGVGDLPTSVTVAEDARSGRKRVSGSSSLSESVAGRTVVRGRALSLVAAGHGGITLLKECTEEESMCRESEFIPEFINKAYDEAEVRAYEELQAKPDPLCRFVARFHGEVMMEPPGSTEAVRYMRLTNLLWRFTEGVHVMDCKLGTRSFVEEEVFKTKLRPDLYKRLVALDPSEPTEEEHKAQACTKYRWMKFNDRLTNIDSLGFRVDGIAKSTILGKRSCPVNVDRKVLKKLSGLDSIARFLIDNFLPAPRPGEQPPLRERMKLQLDAAGFALQALRDLRKAMGASEFVRTHSFIGTSLLFATDAHGPAVDVSLIDFAKTSPLPEGVVVDHSRPWVMGNHEDGLFVGMDNMIKLWEVVETILRVDADAA